MVAMPRLARATAEMNSAFLIIPSTFVYNPYLVLRGRGSPGLLSEALKSLVRSLESIGWF
jgi:hypothetical protein